MRRNHFFKPWTWNPSHPSYRGIKWVTKTHLESKNSVRLLAEGNYFENLWGGFGGYGGRPILMTPKSQQGHMPNASVTDITVRFNWATKTGGIGEILNGLAHCDIYHTGCKGNQCPFACPAHSGNHYSYHDMVFDDVNHTWCQGCARFWLEVTTGTNISSFSVHDINLDHITIVPADPDGFQGGFMCLGGHAPMRNINWTNSIIPTGRYPAWASENGCGDKANSPKEHFDQCFNPYKIDGNLIINSAITKPGVAWPDGNSFPADVAAVHYDPKTYELLHNSPYKGKGTDGRDPGADIPTLLAAVAGVREGKGTDVLELIV